MAKLLRVGHIYPLKRRVGHIYPLKMVETIGRESEVKDKEPKDK